MPLRLVLVPYLLTLLFTGCARRHPLLIPEQAKLIRKEHKYLKPYAKPVQDQIRAAGTTGALVITQGEGATSPIILPANDPLSAAEGNLGVVSTGAGCIFVLKGDLALPPEQFSCASLVIRAKETLAIHARDDQQDAQLSALRGDLETLRNQVMALGEVVKQHEVILKDHTLTLTNHEKALKDQDAALTALRTNLEQLAAVVAPTTNLVSFHDKQLEKIEGMLDSVGKRYERAADAVGQNNKQIDSLITDFNSAFAQVKQALDQMQAKLDTLK